MNLDNFDILICFIAFPASLIAGTVLQRNGRPVAASAVNWAMLLLFTAGDIINLIVTLHDRNWDWAGFWAFALLYTLHIMRNLWRGGKHKRVLEALGAKSRALREKLVQKARDAAPVPARVPA